MASSDLPLSVDLLNLDDLAFRISFKTHVASRPRFAAGGAMGLGLELANIEDMPLNIPGIELEHVNMAHSMLWSWALRRLQNQVRHCLEALASRFYTDEPTRLAYSSAFATCVVQPNGVAASSTSDLHIFLIQCRSNLFSGNTNNAESAAPPCQVAPFPVSGLKSMSRNTKQVKQSPPNPALLPPPPAPQVLSIGLNVLRNYGLLGGTSKFLAVASQVRRYCLQAAVDTWFRKGVRCCSMMYLGP